MPISRQNLCRVGKIKSLYNASEAGHYILEFRDDITAFNGIKHETLAGKGHLNNQINAFLMTLLNQSGIRTHFQDIFSDCESIVMSLQMLPIKCIIHNLAAGRLSRYLGVAAGRPLSPPLYELFLKSDELHDPLISEYHALSLGWATQEQLNEISALSFQINDFLRQIFAKSGLILVDVKLEFGVAEDGRLYLADEISPDTCRIWDSTTHETLDKDRFRQDLGGVLDAYKQVAKRLKVTTGEIPKRS